MADHELTGLNLALAREVYGDDDTPDDAVRPLSRALLDPAPTMPSDLGVEPG
jgi:hypothetical protein